MTPGIQIKGIREGILVIFPGGTWEDLESDFLAEMENQAEFLNGAKLILDVGPLNLKASIMGKLRDQLSDLELNLWAVLSQSEITEQNAQALGLATRIHKPAAQTISASTNTNLDGESAILVRRTLRSGFKLEHPGHITVIGDVNPGAEIIAGGDVVIWGRLRGTVHAGAAGNDEAVVCALDLIPTQLRIGDKIAISPAERGSGTPERASVQGDEVVSEPWAPPGTKK